MLSFFLLPAIGFGTWVLFPRFLSFSSIKRFLSASIWFLFSFALSRCLFGPGAKHDSSSCYILWKRAFKDTWKADRLWIGNHGQIYSQSSERWGADPISWKTFQTSRFTLARKQLLWGNYNFKHFSLSRWGRGSGRIGTKQHTKKTKKLLMIPTANCEKLPVSNCHQSTAAVVSTSRALGAIRWNMAATTAAQLLRLELRLLLQPQQHI